MTTKHCKQCNTTLPIAEFNKNRSTSDGLAYECRKCHSKQNRQHYMQNKSKILFAKDLSHERQRQALRELKKGPCVDCGQTFPYYVMEFDHRDPSTKSFTMSSYGCRSTETILKEIEKCDLVCANCHKARTYIFKKASRDATWARKLANSPNCNTPPEGSALSTELRERKRVKEKD